MLFEQWVAEQDSKIENTEIAADAIKPEVTNNSNDGSIKITVSDPENGSFDIIAKTDKEVDTKYAMSFKTNTSTNTKVVQGSDVLVSPIPDKEGDFDVVIINDPNNPSNSLTYSGKVTVQKQ